MSFFDDLKDGMAIISVVSIVLGLVLVIFPGMTALTLCYCVAAILIIYGLSGIIRYLSKNNAQSVFRPDLIIGLIACAVGLFMIFRAETVISIVIYILGLFILIDGFIKIQKAVELKRLNYSRWSINLVLAILVVVLGLLMLFNPFTAMQTVIILIGITLIYDGLLNIWTLFCLNKAGKGK